MDQIRLTGIRATGKHGVLDFEHERAQTFVVDATLFLDLAAAGRSDDLNDTVDYGAIAKGIVAIIEGEHVDLIEKLANRIVGMILGFPAVCRTQVTVHKPNAPITVPFDDVSVTVERSRETVDSPSRERSSEHGQVHHAIIAMGGNQGDVTATLRDAVRCIDGLPSTQVTGVSPLYRTSRTLDLDIIDFDGQESADPDLTLPHPRAWQRAFVLGPWLALEPDAELGGAHAGSVAQLLHETSDRDHIDEIADDWMVAGAQDPIVRDSDIGTSADDVDAIDDVDSVESIDSIEFPEGTAASKAAAAAAAKPGPASRRAVISLDSVSTDAEHQFRQAIVAIDALPGNQVEGISPLYHVSQVDDYPDKMAAVMQISTRMDARELIGALESVSSSISDDLDLDLVDMEGVVRNEPDCMVPWPSAREHAAVLAPWFDMDPDAKLGRDPVAFLLAMAPDAAQVGMLTDNWIIGDTL